MFAGSVAFLACLSLLACAARAAGTSQGHVVVHSSCATDSRLTDVGSASDAFPVIRRELERSLIVVPRQIRFVRVAYSYRQLRSWLECYIRDGGVVDVTIWPVRTTDNRVGLSVAADSVRSRVEARLRRLGLPREAFDISVGWVSVGHGSRVLRAASGYPNI